MSGLFCKEKAAVSGNGGAFQLARASFRVLVPRRVLRVSLGCGVVFHKCHRTVAICFGLHDIVRRVPSSVNPGVAFLQPLELYCLPLELHAPDIQGVFRPRAIGN